MTHEINLDSSFTSSMFTPISHGYYRSRIHNLYSGRNQLITAAAPLFAIATKLPYSEAPGDYANLLPGLIHEIKAFENKAQIQGYRSNLILAARYILCTFLDEIIKNSLRSTEADTLLQIFHHETWGGEKFFMILERAHNDPSINLELLELIYLCLILGFEGKFTSKNPELLELTNKLYTSIAQYRGDISSALLVQAPEATSNPNYFPSKKTIYIWLLIIVATNFIVYSIGNYYLNQQITISTELQ